MTSGKEHFKLCLDALSKSTTDTEKLLSLVIVTKYLKPSNLGEDELLCLLDKIGINFIHRLLVTIDCDEIDKDCSPVLLQSIAVNILQSIIKVKPDHLEPHVYAKFMSLLSRILMSSKARNNDEILLIDDIIQCFECLIESGLKEEKLMRILCQSGAIKAFTTIHSQGNYGFEKVYSLLSKLASSHFLAFWDPESFHTFLTSVASEFKSNRDQRKFDLCSQLTSFISHNCRWLKLEDGRTHQWLPLVLQGLYDILSSRLDKKHRDPAFFLISALTNAFKGFDWIVFALRLVSLSSDDVKIKKFFPLVARLVCIEICLELRSEKGSEDSNLLGTCFMLLENVISSIVSDEKQDGVLRGMNSEAIIGLYNSLKSTVETVIDYLKNVMSDWETKSQDQTIYQTTLSCIRIVCFWIMEDSGGLKDQIALLIPFMVQLLQDEKSSALVGQFIISAFYEICSSDDRDELKQIIHQHDILPIIKKFQSTSPFKDQIDAICESFRKLNK